MSHRVPNRPGRSTRRWATPVLTALALAGGSIASAGAAPLRLFGGNPIADELIAVDLGTTTTIGGFGANFFSMGMAYDPASETMYCAAFNTALSTIDLETGAITTVGGNPGLMGLAWDANNSILYGVTSSELWTIDTSNGAHTVIGVVGSFANGGGLAYDNENDVLYLASRGDSEPGLYTLDTDTGAAMFIGPFNQDPLALNYGLAHHPGFGLIMSLDVGPSGRLYSVDAATGAATLIAEIPFTSALAFQAPAEAASCQGDANGNGVIDAADLSVLIGGFGQACD